MNRFKAQTAIALALSVMMMADGADAQQNEPGRGGSGVANIEYAPPSFQAAEAPDGDGLGDHRATQHLNMSGFRVMSVANPVDMTDAVNVQYLNAAIASSGDNLGNHIAGQVLVMNNYEITGVGDPTTETSAINLRTLTAAISAAADNLGDHIATMNLTMSGYRVSDIADPASQTDAVNLRTMTSAISAAADNLGNHIATQALSMAGNRITDLADPVDSMDAVNRQYVDGLVGGLPVPVVYTGGQGISITGSTISFDVAWGDGRYALRSRTIATGTGLSGGGDLSANRTVSFDTIWGDDRYALRSRTLSAGDGLMGGGSLAANRSFSVDNTVVRTAGDQTIGGAKTFTGDVHFSNRIVTGIANPVNGTDAANRAFVLSQIAAIPPAPTYTAGTGLTLTGTTFSFNTTWGDTRYALRSRIMTAGDGLIGGGDLTTDRAFAVDATVVRTSGNQTIAGNKTFVGDINFGNRIVAGVADPALDTDAANRRFVMAQFASIPAGTVYTGGTGIDVTGDVISFSTVWGDARYALRSRTVSAGDGLLGGGNLTANRTFAVDGTVVRTSGNQTIDGNKWFIGFVNFGDQVVTGIGNPVNATDAVNLEFLQDQIAAIPAPPSYFAGTGLALTGTTFTFNTVWGDGRYALRSRVMSAGDGLIGGGNLQGDRNFAVDATVVRTAGNQTIAGAKTFTGLVNFSNQVVSGVAAPVAGTDAVNLDYLNAQIGAIPGATTYLAGTGLSLTGSTFSFNTTWGDARYALASRVMTAGDGLSGGGNLTTNRSFAVDATVVRTTGNQTIAGGKTFTGAVNFSNQVVSGVAAPVAPTDAVNRAYVDTQIASIPTGSNYLAGTGLTLTGTTFSFNTTWGDGRYALRSRSMIAGDGLSGGGNLQANRTFSVDATVVRTAGNQTIAGEKTFANGIFLDGERAREMGDPADALDGVNLRTLDAAIAAVTPGGTGLPIGVGDGLQMMANIVSVNSTVVRTTGNQTIAGLKTFRQSSGSRFERAATQDAVVLLGRAGGTGSFSVSITPTTLSANRTLTLANGNTILVAGTMVQTTRSIAAGAGLTGGGDLSANRSLAFDTAWGDARYALASRVMTAGDGLAGGGSLQASRTFAVDGTVVRTSGNQTIAGNKTFTGLVNFSNQVIAGVATPVAGTDAANRDYVDAQIAAIPGATNYLAGTGLALTGSTFSFSTTWGDARYALRSRILTAGDGLTGGGNLQANRTFAVDGTVVRTSGNQSIAGNKTFTGLTSFAGQVVAGIADPVLGTDAANRQFVLSQIAAIPGPTVYSAGTGISLSGTTFSFNSSWGDARYALAARSITAGSGLTGGGTLQANRSFAVDATVVRTSGNQTIAGAKTFSGAVNFSNLVVTGVANPVNGTDAANRQFVLGQIAAIPALAAGTGITVSGSTISFNATWGDARYALATRSMIAGTGITGGGTLQANRTFNFDTTWGDARYALRSRVITAGTGLTGGGNLQANRTVAFDTTWGDARYTNYRTDFNTTTTYDQVLGTEENRSYVFSHSSGGRPSDAPIAAQASGLHIANTWGRAQIVMPNQASNRMFFRTGTLTAWAEVWHSGNLNPGSLVQTSRSIIAGTGLSGGGQLNADRTISFNTTWGDARYALASRSMIAGTGITGGGTLQANRTFNFDTTWGDARYALRERNLAAGDGLTGGGNLQANRTFAVDGTVVRTSGNQTIAGNKTFTGSVNFGNLVVTGVANPVNGTDAANRQFVLAQIAASSNPVAGTGITVSGMTISFSTAWGDARYALASRQMIAGTGITGGGTLQANRTFNFDTTWGDARYALRSRTITAGTGLSGGGNLQANRTIQVAATVFRNDAANAGNLRFTSGNGSGIRFWDSAEYSIYMSATSDGTWGGRRDSTSDHNMYFRMGGGTNRGFIFRNGGTNVAQIDGGGNLYFAGTMHQGNVPWARVTGAPNFVQTGVTISTNNGIAGGGNLSANRTFGLTGQALALHNLSTNGFITRTGSGVVQARTFVGGSGIAVTNGNGVSGNPSIAVDGTVVRTTGHQQIQGVKTFRAANGTRFERSDGMDAVIIAGRNGGTQGHYVVIRPTTLSGTHQLTLANGATTLVQGTMVSTTGNQTIGGAKTFTSNMTVNANVYANLYLHNSDRTLKDDIEIMEGGSALEVLGRVEPVTYTWRDTGAHSMGVIAQDLREIYPHAVFEHPTNGTLTVEYTQLIAPMIASIQELDEGLDEARAEIEALRRENAELQMIIGTFEERLEAIEVLLR